MKNEILIEIFHLFKEQVFKKVWFKLLMGALAIIFVWLSYMFIFNRAPLTIGEIGNEQVWEDYKQVLELENGEEVTLTNLQSEQIDTTLNMFFTMANEMNANLFTSAIDSERLIKDFEQYPLGERFAKYEEVMQRISRNQTLVSIDVIRTIPHLEKDTKRIVIDLYYADLDSPKRVSVLVKMIEQYDINTVEGELYKIPFISSSVWELIEMIEKGDD